MYIDLNKDNITFITTDQSKNNEDFPGDISPQDFLRRFKSKDRFNYLGRYSKFAKIKGFFIGSNKDIKNHLLENITDNYDTKNVFIDKFCNIPNHDLQEKGITRKRSYESADICVVPNPNFKRIVIYDSRSVIFYNKSTNEFIITTSIDTAYRWNAAICDKFSKMFKTNKSDFIAAMYNYGIISRDFEVVENVLEITNNKDEFFINNYKNYKNCVFEKDYLNYLNGDKEVLTNDLLTSIKDMMLSNDNDVVNMSLQLLYSFNPRPLAYSLYSIMHESFSRYRFSITDQPFYKSSKFDKFLSLMSLNKKDLRCDKETLREKLFNICGDEDKEKILTEITQEAYSTYQAAIRNIKRYSFLKDSVDIINPKVIYNEKDYFDTRK